MIILTDFERKSGHPHRYRDAAVHNYTRLLAAMRKSEAEIKAAIAALTGEGGK